MDNSEKIHQTKLTLLITITLVLGVISVLSLFFVIKMRSTKNIYLPQPEVVEENVVVEEKEKKPEVENALEINLEKQVKELDELDLESIEDAYSNFDL